MSALVIDGTIERSEYCGLVYVDRGSPHHPPVPLHRAVAVPHSVAGDGEPDGDDQTNAEGQEGGYHQHHRLYDHCHPDTEESREEEKHILGVFVVQVSKC